MTSSQLPRSGSQDMIGQYILVLDIDRSGRIPRWQRLTITDEMVERAALVCAHADGYEGSDVVPSDAYRHQARKVLSAALSTKYEPEEGTDG